MLMAIFFLRTIAGLELQLSSAILNISSVDLKNNCFVFVFFFGTVNYVQISHLSSIFSSIHYKEIYSLVSFDYLHKPEKSIFTYIIPVSRTILSKFLLEGMF